MSKPVNQLPRTLVVVKRVYGGRIEPTARRRGRSDGCCARRLARVAETVLLRSQVRWVVLNTLGAEMAPRQPLTAGALLQWQTAVKDSRDSLA